MPPYRDVAEFNDRAASYDHGWRGRLHHEISERTANLALATVPGPHRVLDLGCGPKDQAPVFAHLQCKYVGIDVNNAGSTQSSVTLRAQGLPDVSTTLEPGQLRRIRTGWTTPTSQITVSMQQGSKLKFDNIAFVHP